MTTVLSMADFLHELKLHQKEALHIITKLEEDPSLISLPGVRSYDSDEDLEQLHWSDIHFQDDHQVIYVYTDYLNLKLTPAAWDKLKKIN